MCIHTRIPTHTELVRGSSHVGIPGIVSFPHLRTFLFFPPPVIGDRGGWFDLFLSFTSNNKWDVLCFVSAGGRDAAARDEVNV